MMLDWFYRLIHFRQRRMVVLRLTQQLPSTEGGRLVKREADAGTGRYLDRCCESQMSVG